LTRNPDEDGVARVQGEQLQSLQALRRVPRSYDPGAFASLLQLLLANY
jgi:hypothetical protein